MKHSDKPLLKETMKKLQPLKEIKPHLLRRESTTLTAAPISLKIRVILQQKETTTNQINFDSKLSFRVIGLPSIDLCFNCLINFVVAQKFESKVLKLHLSTSSAYQSDFGELSHLVVLPLQ